MDLSTLPLALRPLVQRLEFLSGPADLSTLAKILSDTQPSYEDVKAYAHFDASHYRRNMVSTGPWYELIVICWRSGQRNPIHDHSGSVCALKVMSGMATEVVYQVLPDGTTLAERTSEKREGEIVASMDKDAHQIANLQAGDADLVTLHIYSPPLRDIRIFDHGVGCVVRNQAIAGGAEVEPDLVRARLSTS